MSELSHDQKMKYVDLWMQQSQLLWSRLKVVSLLQTGVLVAWYNLMTINAPGYAKLTLGIGVLISFFIMAIMKKDGLYLGSLREKAEDAFPVVSESNPKGTLCAIGIAGTFASIDFILLIIGLATKQ